MLPKSREAPIRMTEWEMKLLSDIFRVILKEITCDEDKEKLAPGEMGINYDEGSLYVRDPHTGELFCPNSIAHLKQILSKYDPVTNILNADRVSGVRFYSSISQLDQLGISLSADSIVRQMEYPSVLMASVEYENYDKLGFPSESGTMLVYKVDPEFVTATFYDNRSYTLYNGKYNSFTHVLEGWSVSSGFDSDYIETEGGGDNATIRSDRVLRDLDLLVVRVTEALNPGATITYNDSAPMPIILPNGNPLKTTIEANNIIMLLYDEQKKSWIYLTNSESSMSTIVAMLNDRINAVRHELAEYKQYMDRHIGNLRDYIDNQIANISALPGNIVTKTSIYTAAVDSVDTINHVADFVPDVDKLIVNYNQTLLRPDIDYTVEAETGGIQLKGFTLAKGEILQFIVIKQTGATP